MARYDIHIAKRGSTQQFRILLLAGDSFLLTSIDVVTGDIVFRADGPGEVEISGRAALRGNQHDDESLRRGGRESIERGDFDDGRVGRFNLQIGVLRDAADAVAVGLSELNLGVAEGWRCTFADENGGVWRSRWLRPVDGRDGLRHFAAKDSIAGNRRCGSDGGFLRRGPGKDHALVSDFGFEVRDRFRGGSDPQDGGIGIRGDFLWRGASAHGVNRLRVGMLGEILGLERVFVANLASRVESSHHRRRDGYEQRGIGGNGRWRGARGIFLEIAEDFDCGRLLELATLDGFLGKSKGEDHVVALLGGGEIGDCGGNRRFAFDWLTGSAAAGKKDDRSENGKEKMENGGRHS